MADETCAVTVKTLPAVADLEVKARLETKNAFLATKELVLDSAKTVNGITDSNGEAVLNLIRDAKLIDKDVASIPHYTRVGINKDGVKVNVTTVVPNSATADFADTIQT